MATEEEMQEALSDALVKLAKQAGESSNGTMVRAYSYASNQIAEALAWLEFPNQPHGGTSISE